MIGIIGAMQLETQALRQQMTNATVHTVSDTEFYVGQLWGKDAVVGTCGPGKVFAALCAHTMIHQFGADTIINVGVAGNLSPNLHKGDLVIATATVQHDYDTSPLGGTVGMVCKIDRTYFDCDAALQLAATKAAVQLGIPHLAGIVATGDQFIADAAQKQLLISRFGAVACEMEGGAVGHACYINHVPYLVLRAISDDADGGAAGDFETFARAAAHNAVCLLEAMFKAI